VPAFLFGGGGLLARDQVVSTSLRLVTVLDVVSKYAAAR
jgi:hypothetical protein